jgi:hypothetical protein
MLSSPVRACRPVFVQFRHCTAQLLALPNVLRYITNTQKMPFPQRLRLIPPRTPGVSACPCIPSTCCFACC